MKVAVHPKFFLLLIAGALSLALSGCGSSNLALTQGNWSVVATSTATDGASRIRKQTQSAAPTFYVGGNLTQSGGSVSATMYVVGSLCFDSSQTVTFTGKIDGKKISLTSAPIDDQVITVSASGVADSFTGTYSIAGGCADGDQGTVTASVVSSISGTWTGSLINPACAHAGCANATVSFALTQATSASENGTFPLTGTLTYTNFGCSVSGTITEGFLQGQYVTIIGNTLDFEDSPGTFNYELALVDSATTPANMTAAYEQDNELCNQISFDPTTLTKQ